jgi:two-component system, response regulator PdtaR
MKNKFKIMVVEDEAITAMMICNELRLKGYNVGEPASSGEEAILRADSEKPHLIIMDVGLGGSIDGIAAAEHIFAKLETRFAFMTGYSSEVFMERSRKLSPLAFLVKPLQMHELYKVINCAIETL